MKFTLLKPGNKRQQKNRHNRTQVLEFIANHAAKTDFINWLNANYEQQFPEDADWDSIVLKVKNNTAIHNLSLHNYASTLTKEEDVTNLLKEVEKETEKAEETVSRLYDTANAKRIKPVIGGACLLGGFLLLIGAAGLLTDVIELGVATDIGLYIAALGGVYGLLTVFAGFLLVSE